MCNHETIKSSLNDGETYAGLILGKNGQPDYHLVLLPGDANDVTWSAASKVTVRWWHGSLFRPPNTSEYMRATRLGVLTRPSRSGSSPIA